MAMKKFKAESQKLLDLMINSIYTNKEIFLRELISNASDALDKLRFKGLTDDSVGLGMSDFAITLTPNKESRTLKISDNGIGMTKEELEKTMDPSKYTGRASVQVDAFLKNVVNPVLEANKEALGMTAEINV